MQMYTSHGLKGLVAEVQSTIQNSVGFVSDQVVRDPIVLPEDKVLPDFSGDTQRKQVYMILESHLVAGC